MTSLFDFLQQKEPLERKLDYQSIYEALKEKGRIVNVDKFE